MPRKIFELTGETDNAEEWQKLIKEQEALGWKLYGQEPIEKIVTVRMGTRYLFKKDPS